MKKIILYGNTEFTKLMKFYIETDTNRVIEAVTVEEEYKEAETFEGLPLVAFEKIESIYLPEKFEILICIGYNQMNTIREKITNKCKKRGYTIASYIHSTANIAKNVKMGDGNIILENVLIQPNGVIGSGNLTLV